MDDDDLYMASYIEYSVSKLLQGSLGLVCCKTMLILFPESEGKVVFVSGQVGHEATFCHTKQHWRLHKYKSARSGEGQPMVRGRFDNDLDIRKVVVCVVHDNNTFNKTMFSNFPVVPLTQKQKQALINLL